MIFRERRGTDEYIRGSQIINPLDIFIRSTDAVFILHRRLIFQVQRGQSILDPRNLTSYLMTVHIQRIGIASFHVYIVRSFRRDSHNVHDRKHAELLYLGHGWTRARAICLYDCDHIVRNLLYQIGPRV